MNTTTTTITALPARVRHALMQGVECHDAEAGREDFSGLDMLGMDEDTATALFGADVADALADAEVIFDLELVELCCITFDCPGQAALFGSVTVDAPGVDELGSYEEDHIDW